MPLKTLLRMSLPWEGTGGSPLQRTSSVRRFGSWVSSTRSDSLGGSLFGLPSGCDRRVTVAGRNLGSDINSVSDQCCRWFVLNMEIDLDASSSASSLQIRCLQVIMAALRQAVEESPQDARMEVPRLKTPPFGPKIGALPIGPWLWWASNCYGKIGSPWTQNHFRSSNRISCRQAVLQNMFQNVLKVSLLNYRIVQFLLSQR